MLNERYGNLLDNVMNKKDSTMIDTVDRLNSKIKAERQAENDRINSSIRNREFKEQAECERVENTNVILNKYIDKIKAKQEAEIKQSEAEKAERKRRELSAQTKIAFEEADRILTRNKERFSK